MAGLVSCACALPGAPSSAQPLPPAPRPPQGAWPAQRLFDVSYLPGKEAAGVADPQRTLDLYLPATGASGKLPPLFIYIHGGAWVSGDKRQYRPLGEALAGEGVAAAVINYRLSGDGPDSVRHPAHVKDAAMAVAWLRRHAAEYGYDPTRVFVGGHSAGAHMTALLAYDSALLWAVGEKPDALRGFVGIEGIYDIPELVRRFPSYRVDFLQLAFGSDEAAWRTASPQHLLQGAGGQRRPFLLIHSRRDELVDIEQSQRFHKALEKQGFPARFLSPELPAERGSHFGVLLELASPRSALKEVLLAFLRS